MANYTMTSKEQSMLNDVLSTEKLLMSKYQAYSNQLQDPNLKSLFQQMSTQSQQNTQSITQLFSQAGISPANQ
ncbi:MAG: spore coat protein [Methylocystaceae bacterium]